MILREEIIKQGQWLFKWRSFLPFIFLPILFLALRESELAERFFGERVNDCWEVFSFAISLTGLAVRCLVHGYAPRGTSGRNIKEQWAKTLNTTGMYSIVRHPLYLGNFIIILGILLFLQVWWFALLGVMFFWIYYERIIFTEEEYLREKFGSSFLEWAQITPIAFPKFKSWKKPELPFSFKTVLRREHSTLFAIIASFAALDIAADLVAEHVLDIDLFWAIIFIVGLIIYLVLRTLKKKTHVLDIPGR